MKPLLENNKALPACLRQVGNIPGACDGCSVIMLCMEDEQGAGELGKALANRIDKVG